jgi:hypothetical protein
MEEHLKGGATTIELLQDSLNTLKRTFEQISATKMEERIELSDPKLKAALSCPITCEIMVVPVTLPCGHTFESNAIERALKNKGECPVCRKSTSDRVLTTIKPSVALGDVIDLHYPGLRSKKLVEPEHKKQKSILKLVTGDTIAPPLSDGPMGSDVVDAIMQLVCKMNEMNRRSFTYRPFIEIDSDVESDEYSDADNDPDVAAWLRCVITYYEISPFSRRLINEFLETVNCRLVANWDYRLTAVRYASFRKAL